jgi:hypothetical protein
MLDGTKQEHYKGAMRRPDRHRKLISPCRRAGGLQAAPTLRDLP